MDKELDENKMAEEKGNVIVFKPLAKATDDKYQESKEEGYDEEDDDEYDYDVYDDEKDSDESELVDLPVKLDFKTAFRFWFKRNKWILLAFVLVIIVNALAWSGPAISKATGLRNWCDVYTDYVNPLLVAVLSSIPTIVPFSIGELMIVAGILLLLTVLVSTIILPVLRKKQGYKRYYKRLIRFLVMTLVIVSWVMTLNCSIYYHVDPMKFDKTDLGNKELSRVDKLEILRNYVVAQCNDLSEQMRRDKEGVVYIDPELLDKEAQKAMHKLSAELPRLKGYYPDVKPMLFSWLMTQSYMCGYYFPFSMEANINKYMFDLNFPVTYCHELSHLHGYIYEDEANFIGYLACLNSDLPEFKYSGYLSVLYYLDDDYYFSVGDERYFDQIEISGLVHLDNRFVPEEIFKKIEDSSPVNTETMDQVSDTLTDASISFNGVEDGILSYSRVVDLMLQYYEGILY